MTTPNGSSLLENTLVFVAGVAPRMGQATAGIAARAGAQAALVARDTEIVEKTADERSGRPAGRRSRCSMT